MRTRTHKYIVLRFALFELRIFINTIDLIIIRNFDIKLNMLGVNDVDSPKSEYSQKIPRSIFTRKLSQGS